MIYKVSNSFLFAIKFTSTKILMTHNKWNVLIVIILPSRTKILGGLQPKNFYVKYWANTEQFSIFDGSYLWNIYKCRVWMVWAAFWSNTYFAVCSIFPELNIPISICTNSHFFLSVKYSVIFNFVTFNFG